ncbi:MAG: circularly permuted type 2 ATP-grasp protein, partial [Alphaproteobacteria bacterium]
MPDQHPTPPFAAFDEMASGRGVIRPHWRDLIATVWSMPPGQIAEKMARARAQFAEADEFLAIYGKETRRPAWTFDLLPLILPEAEWQGLTEGLAQRARLLDMILADIYGPQDLIKERFIPPYLVYANPEFLRPMRHVKPIGGGPYLYFYAADLVRSPDGGWRVFADRTQAAAGVGYALRNRRVMARTFPEVFRAAPVRRLQPFVDQWQDSLRRVGSSLHADPHSVLLTPGPYNNAYFEHVYLARELGITLAQGSDLTVRDDKVYLKTLEGLLRIDVIYRRLDAAFADPLELRDDSALGIAGLVQAQRAGNVAVVNMPGSAVIETPAYAPFLPSIARRLLGEELKLPAVTTWWCGQAAPLAEVKSRLEGFVLRPAFAPDPEPIEAERLDATKRAMFDIDLATHPERYVALERVTHGVVPTMSDGGMVPQPIVLRVALVWHDGNWHALPGGVARVVGADKLYRSTLRHGGIAKDVWVLTGEPQDVYVPSAKRSSADTRRAKAALQSRAADDLYWLGRYAERLDTGARLFRAVLNRMVGGGLGARDFAELSLLARALQRT